MNDKARLILSSFLMLFVELALIRWLGSNVIYLSYFSNFVLMGSFLGIGLGFLQAKARTDWFAFTLVLLTLLVGFARIFPVTINRSGSDLIYFGAVFGGLPIWLLLPAIFLATAMVMASIAQAVARLFGRFAPLEAYRLDILGSLAGVAAFSALAFLGTPPVVWGAIVTGLCVLLYLPKVTFLHAVAGVGLVILLGQESLTPGASWSPYYKIRLFPARGGAINLTINGVPHQVIEAMAMRRKYEPIYFVPYARLHGNPLRNVMVIGAGDGGDVAIALAAGAEHVDAVEIDPDIYRIGYALNPDKPYHNRRVTIHIDDGRAFLQQTKNRYDLILFALPDSLSVISGQSALRLESYLFSYEAISAARSHLTPVGAFGMYNYYRESWLVDRYARTIEAAFGAKPCVDSVGWAGKFVVFVVGREAGNVRCRTVWTPATSPVPEPATDDHPFPYLRVPSIPSLYLGAVSLILLVSLVLVRIAAGPLSGMRDYSDLFFMGCAFLLLETKNVVQFALLFGTTWFVNALVFFGILVAVLAAIEVARRLRIARPGWVYVALLGSLSVAWAVKPEWLLTLDFATRFTLSTALAFAPIFLANLVFAQRFRDIGSSTTAFAANLLGAMVGGVLEYSSLLLGYRNLLVVVAVLYGLSFIIGRRWLAFNVAGSDFAGVTSSAGEA